MPRNQLEEFLGVDIGQSRVGVARGSSLARLAEPLKTVDAPVALDEIMKLVEEMKVDGVVIGLPRNLDGQETAQTRTVRQWVEQAKSRLKLSFYWQDEALTSAQAEADGRYASRGSDAAAAAIILQDFLDTPKVDRVKA